MHQSHSESHQHPVRVFAALANREGQPRRAAVLWGASQRLRDDVGAPLLPSERASYEREVAQGRVALGEDAFEMAWAEGQAMSTEQAIQYALVEP